MENYHELTGRLISNGDSNNLTKNAFSEYPNSLEE